MDIKEFILQIENTTITPMDRTLLESILLHFNDKWSKVMYALLKGSNNPVIAKSYFLQKLDTVKRLIPLGLEATILDFNRLKIYREL